MRANFWDWFVVATLTIGVSLLVGMCTYDSYDARRIEQQTEALKIQHAANATTCEEAFRFRKFSSADQYTVALLACERVKSK